MFALSYRPLRHSHLSAMAASSPSHNKRVLEWVAFAVQVGLAFNACQDCKKLI